MSRNPQVVESDRLLTLAEAAALTPWAPGMLRKACHATDPNAVPPPLPAKRGPRGQLLILQSVLNHWMQSLPDN